MPSQTSSAAPRQPSYDKRTARASSPDRKRKHLSRNSATPLENQAAAPRQQTISDLFSASQQKVSSSRESSYTSPGSKRQKLSHRDSSPPPSSAPPASSPLSADRMYNFPSSRQSNGSNVIDLTGKTPPASPQPRRPNGALGTTRIIKPGLTQQNGVKKLEVKNFQLRTKSDPQKYFNNTWVKLDTALDAIFAEQHVAVSLEELYKGVENCCRQGYAAELQKKLEKKSKAFAEEGLRNPLRQKAEQQDNVSVLRATVNAWGRWCKMLVTIRSIFFYMNQSHLLPNKSSIQDIWTNLFKRIVFQDPVLRPKIVDGACDLVTSDRRGQSPDLSVFRDAVNLFHELTTYTSVFEPRLLEVSQQFVMEWVSETEGITLPEYIRSSGDLMKNELQRCEVFNLDSSTRRDLSTLLEDHLVQRQKDRLANQDDLADLLDDAYEQMDDKAVTTLAKLYELLAHRNLEIMLRSPFGKWIEDTGTAIIFDEKAEDTMVVRLLALKKRLDLIWRLSFQRKQELGHALRESFETFINKTKKSAANWGTDNSKPGEMIAKYVDMILRGGSKAIPAALSAHKQGERTALEDEDGDDVMFDEDTEINNQLDQVLDLFRFVHGKAVFEAFYKKDLARRLLMGRSASADAERNMLSRLKTECGSGFTHNLEQMFKDVELAREEMASYKSLIADRHEALPGNIDLSVNVLSSAAWPTYPDVPVIVPPDVQTSISKFEQHYKSKHSGRVLTWKHALAHCQIKANFPRGKKEIVVSSFQAIVLLLFNKVTPDEHLSYERIKAETGLVEAELNRTLQSLACAKLRPLTKHPKGRDINPTDTFTLNLSFQHEKYRVKINQVQLKETKAENKETHERVAKDRQFETQAAIVRIMKSRKKISHQELIVEVINATKSRGVLAVPDIKKNIDKLIEKDYMEREEGNMYAYVA